MASSTGGILHTDRIDTKCDPDFADKGLTSPFLVQGHDFVCGLSTPASFEPEFFEAVMLNLIQNPNLTSSFLYRADIFYDSDNDASYQPSLAAANEHPSTFAKHMKQEYRPMWTTVSDWTLERTIVRQLVPRNPKVDKPLVQTCHILAQDTCDQSQTLVLLLPHVQSPDEMPFYHPTVRGLAFLYRWGAECDASGVARGLLSIHVGLFDGDSDFAQSDSRLSRTLLKLLQTTHKHATGSQNGYKKQASHDQMVPQRRFQDTYTRLKGKYAKHLVETWHESTDPVKHVFEDLGIAAFLIELWKDMYDAANRAFPGFIDIGCGNGLLVHILTQEGFSGWGFDVRRRKSWHAYSDLTKSRLKELVLVPRMFQEALACQGQASLHSQESFHDGCFPKGTFIISNHADELTVWTPVLAALSQCPFVSIPCCSHNFAGDRFRAPPGLATTKVSTAPKSSSKSTKHNASHNSEPLSSETDLNKGPQRDENETGGKSGSLKRSGDPRTASKYSTLCTYVLSITEQMGFQPKIESLRIPSTRKTAILGLYGDCLQQDTAVNSTRAASLVKQELSADLASSARRWLERSQAIAASTGSASH